MKTMKQKEKIDMLRADFEREIVSLQCRVSHYKGGNTAMADKYSTEIRHIERLLRVLDVLTTKK